MNPDLPGDLHPTYRSCTAGETFSKVSPYLARLGITRIARHTDLDRIGVPVWGAYVPNAKAIVIAQGKGLTDEVAKTSAVMEAVERVIATRPACGGEELSVTELSQRCVKVHKLDCLLAAGAMEIGVDERMHWTPARSLVDGNDVWVPFDAIHLDRTIVNSRYWLSSDGLSAGNTQDEATLHGLLERVERDAITLWEVRSLAKRYECKIALRHINDLEVVSLVQRIEQAGLELAMFDITSDLGVPTMVALLAPRRPQARRDLRHIDITFGAGASFSPGGAMLRAITEAVQSRMTYISGARDDILPDMFTQPALADHIAAFVAPAQKMHTDIPSLTVSSINHALKTLVSRLADKGVEHMLAIELAPDWLPVSVVKVIVPELENPDGARRQHFGMRALSMSLQ